MAVNCSAFFSNHLWKYLRNLLFVLCLIHLLTISTAQQEALQEAPVTDLYTDADHMVNLNKTNIKSKLLGQQTAFILEFYNSWCGYCIGFAPTWKAFADDVKNWKSVAQVAAVNCAQEFNTDVCRDYKVAKYPSVRYFWTNAQANDVGDSANHSYSVEKLRRDWIDFFHVHWSQGIPKNWPKLEPVQVASLSEIWNYLTSVTKQVVLIVEETNSYIGREVMLDLSSYDVTVLRALNTNSKLVNELKEKLGSDIQSFPSMCLLKRNDGAEILSGPAMLSRETFRDLIKKKVLGLAIEAPVHPMAANTERPKPVKKVPIVATPVHMVDLENTIHYALKREVVLQNMIDGERLDALRSFVRLLYFYFPGRDPVRKFLHKLHLQLSMKKTNQLTAQEFKDMMKSVESSDSFIPPMEDWVGCRGSVAKYRGYSCGLWMLFHVLSAEAYQQLLNKKGDANLLEDVLIPIREYVINFFSCSECAKNFQKEAETLEKDIKVPNDTVIWLWWTHNDVNRRLAGDASEDPQHPKLQYPPAEICAKCHLPGSTDNLPLWNETVVLQYLVEHYTNIKTQENHRLSRTANAATDFSGEHSGAEGMRSLTWKRISWLNFKYFSGVDISLCVLLYVSSAVLLVIVYLIFMLKKSRRKYYGYKLP